MSSSLIRGKYLVTRVIDQHSSEIISNGSVYQRNGEIVEIGNYEELKAKHQPDTIIGSENQVILPGLINAHHHVGLTPFQLGSLDLPLETWIADRMATRDVDTYLDTIYCAIQMIESGITTVMHNHATHRKPAGSSFEDEASQVITAYQNTGMRVAFSFSHRNQNNLVYQEDSKFLATLPTELSRKLHSKILSTSLSTDDYLQLFADIYEKYGRNQSHDRIRIFLSPSNVQWCSDDLLQEIKACADKYQVGIHIHLQESIYQKLYGMRHWDKTPLAHLNDLGFLGPEVSCAHGVWLTESDIGLLSSTNTMICHNASSNLRLKSGVAPLNQMTAKGVKVAIGIDEAGINDDNDILQEMRLVQKIHRVPGVTSPYPTSHQVLHMATVNGAKATLLADDIGTLEIGKRADIILVNLDHITQPYLDPDTNIVDAVLYRGRGLDVDTVMVDGEVLMINRKLTKVNKEEIWAELTAQLSYELNPDELEKRTLARQFFPYVQRFYEKWQLEGEDPHYKYNNSL